MRVYVAAGLAMPTLEKDSMTRQFGTFVIIQGAFLLLYVFFYGLNPQIIGINLPYFLRFY